MSSWGSRRYIPHAIGQRFGRWTVISDVPRNDSLSNACWNVRCECGATGFIKGIALRNGESSACMSCGHADHGMTNTKVWRAWAGMRSRCRDPKRKDYCGRGISVCERWEAFENFLADMGEPPTSKHSLDRVDVNGNYEPGNCRWATITQQIRNRRCTVTTEQIALEILGRFEHGESCPSIAVRLGWQRAKVIDVVLGAAWRELHRPWIGRLPAEL